MDNIVIREAEISDAEEMMIETERLTEYPSLYSYCKYTNEASYKTAEAIGMHFDKEYPDEANKITHVSVIHRAATGKDR
jgi:aspartate oxidase